MKNLKQLSLLLLSVLSTGILLISCKKDKTTNSTDTTPVINNPTISLVGGSGYASADYTTTVGASPIKIKFIALSNTSSGSKLDNVHTTITSNNLVVYNTTATYTNNATSVSDSIVVPTVSAGISRLEITVTDKAGLTANVGINITIVAVTPSVKSIGTGTITLGGTVDNNPSYLNMYSGSTYNAANAAANASAIDLVYNKTKLYSPSDNLEANSTIHTSGIITKLDLYTAKGYSSITPSDVDAYVPSNSTNVTIANGSVIMFLTSTGKKGVLHIVSFNGSASSTTADNISFEGVVQQ